MDSTPRPTLHGLGGEPEQVEESSSGYQQAAPDSERRQLASGSRTVDGPLWMPSISPACSTDRGRWQAFNLVKPSAVIWLDVDEIGHRMHQAYAVGMGMRPR